MALRWMTSTKLRDLPPFPQMLKVPVLPAGFAFWQQARWTAIGDPTEAAFLVSQLGCDTHHTDPLANLMLTTAAYRSTAGLLHELAHRAAGGRWIATGGGGYQWARVVPRAWTIYFAELAGMEPPDRIPDSWIEAAKREGAGDVPGTLSEPAVEEMVVSAENLTKR